MMQTAPKTTILAWVLAGAALVAGPVYLWGMLAAEPALVPARIVELVTFSLVLPVLYAGLGALIVTRRPGNRVGWLMILSSLDIGGLLQVIFGLAEAAPPVLTTAMWLTLWFSNWSWVIFIFPIFLIPLYFPDGNLPAPRWAWVFRLAVVLGLFLAVASAFAETIGPIEATWTVPNPVGLIPIEFFGTQFLVLWGIGLLTVVAGSVASLLYRFRRARAQARDQIKWLLFAGFLFFLGYGITYYLDDAASDAAWNGPIFIGSLALIPIAIAIAILRRRLYDIDLIIRRAPQYTIITAALAAAYFGGIVVFQALLEAVGRTLQPARASLWISNLPEAAFRNAGRPRNTG